MKRTIKYLLNIILAVAIGWGLYFSYALWILLPAEVSYEASLDLLETKITNKIIEHLIVGIAPPY